MSERVHLSSSLFWITNHFTGLRKRAEPVALALEVTLLGEQLHYCFYNNFCLSAKKVCELLYSKNLKTSNKDVTMHLNVII